MPQAAFNQYICNWQEGKKEPELREEQNPAKGKGSDEQGFQQNTVIFHSPIINSMGGSLPSQWGSLYCPSG
jgi:hypothetical protein